MATCGAPGAIESPGPLYRVVYADDIVGHPYGWTETLGWVRKFSTIARAAGGYQDCRPVRVERVP